MGDGKTTCTLCQKGDNYAQVEEEKGKRLSTLILKSNTIITSKPTLTTSCNDNTGDTYGLYSSTDTNSGKETYYFRGSVKNNYVSFAGLTWKVIRINEDGTVRLILNDRIGGVGSIYKFNTKYSNYSYMYYSNGSNAKTQVENWYKTNIEDKGYDSYVATAMFCEQAKVKEDASYTSGNAVMELYTKYTPNFKCSADGNGKGILDLKVGLITYDEVVHAGGYYGKENRIYFLYNGQYGIWTMSPAGIRANSYVWRINYNGSMDYKIIDLNEYALRPVINLNANVIASGTGTSSDPYVVQTNK